MGEERPLRSVPGFVHICLLLALVAHLGWYRLAPPPQPVAQALPEPPGRRSVELAALGDDVTAAKVLMLWLQAFDNQPGLSVPFQSLDYARLERWLELILELDPRAHYPLLAAGRLYALVPDPERQRRMLEFVYERFLEAPNERWRWLAQAALIAKHRLKDLPLALRYARALTGRTTHPHVPYWARDLTVIILIELKKWQAVRGLIGDLLAGGQIADPHELQFLRQRLNELPPSSATTGKTRYRAGRPVGDSRHLRRGEELNAPTTAGPQPDRRIFDRPSTDRRR